jgi:transposase
LVARLRAELGLDGREVVVPQAHGRGEEAEVDFGEFMVDEGGVSTRWWLFVMRLSASGALFAAAYRTQAQEVFFDGHVRAFEWFGGVPGRIRYDNLKAAVTDVALGRRRVENERFIELRSFYGFDAFFCRPGVEGAHEKGLVS